MPALQGGEDDVLHLVGWRDDPYRQLGQLQLSSSCETFAAVKDGPVGSDLERLDDPALAHVVDQGRPAVFVEQR